MVLMLLPCACPAESGREAREADLQEEYMPYYRAMIREKDRFDYQDYGEAVAGYQYALVYLSEEDPIPALLLAERSWDDIRYIKVFQYDPDSRTLIEPLEPLNEYRAMLYLGDGGRGLLMWFSDGYMESGIMEIRMSDGSLLYGPEVWRGPNDGTWPESIPREEIEWIDAE